MSPRSHRARVDRPGRRPVSLFSVRMCTEMPARRPTEGGRNVHPGTDPVGPAPVLAARRLFEALATPHGVDRYLELVNPMLTVRELRAEVTDVHRSTADTVTLTLRPTRQWRGFQAGQFVQLTVDIDGVRRTRCYSPAGSQHRVGRPHRAHGQGPPRRRGLAVPARPRRTGPGRRAGPGRRHLPAAASPGRPRCVLDQRRQRDHPGAVDAAHALRRGLPRPGDVPALQQRRGRRRPTATNCCALAAEHDNVKLVLAYTAQRRRRPARLLRPGAPGRRRPMGATRPRRSCAGRPA